MGGPFLIVRCGVGADRAGAIPLASKRQAAQPVAHIGRQPPFEMKDLSHEPGIELVIINHLGGVRLAAILRRGHDSPHRRNW